MGWLLPIGRVGDGAGEFPIRAPIVEGGAHHGAQHVGIVEGCWWDFPRLIAVGTVVPRSAPPAVGDARLFGRTKWTDDAFQSIHLRQDGRYAPRGLSNVEQCGGGYGKMGLAGC